MADVLIVPPADLKGLDLARLGNSARSPFDGLEDRARARALVYQPITTDELLDALRGQGFFPHGIYLPDDEQMRIKVHAKLEELGFIGDTDLRQRKYQALQDAGERWEAKGIPGHWTGQQAWARSRAQFRIVAVGRRGGKSKFAANEAVAFARTRPRSRVWVCAPNMDLVARPFDLIVELIGDLRLSTETFRNSAQHKLIVLENGSAIEGVSLENPGSSAGAAVDFAIIDEAAQVDERAWTRAVLPPLADRQGRALLISSYEGEDAFFFEKAERARVISVEKGKQSAWAFFQEPSWDTNFYLFPQGRSSPMLEILREEMDLSPGEFLEQFGAIPARNKTLVFPEFREKVHVDPAVAFNPEYPVWVGVDPTGGNSVYAVVVAQYYDDHLYVIDEFGQPATSAAEISRFFEDKPWRKNVTDMVVDSAAFTEATNWALLGWPAYPVFEKPPITDRLPIHRNLLRDPKAYYDLYRALTNAILEKRGREPNSDFFASPREQLELVEEVEKMLSDRDISSQHLAVLRRTARLHIAPHCTEIIREHKRYRYPKKKPGIGVRENPVDADNDYMDAAGYLCWSFRHLIEQYTIPANDQAVIKSLVVDVANPLPEVLDLRPPPVPATRQQGFLRACREQFRSTGQHARVRSIA